MFSFHTDAALLVDGIDAGRKEGLVDGTIDELDFEVDLALACVAPPTQSPLNKPTCRLAVRADRIARPSFLGSDSREPRIPR